MLQELPESWRTSLKALAHCVADPGIITRTPGRCSSVHLDKRYSIVLLRSRGAKKTFLANLRWLTTCSPAIARNRKTSATLTDLGVLSSPFLVANTTNKDSASSISFL